MYLVEKTYTMVDNELDFDILMDRITAPLFTHVAASTGTALTRPLISQINQTLLDLGDLKYVADANIRTVAGKTTVKFIHLFADKAAYVRRCVWYGFHPGSDEGVIDISATGMTLLLTTRTIA